VNVSCRSFDESNEAFADRGGAYLTEKCRIQVRGKDLEILTHEVVRSMIFTPHITSIR
jgi:hypothetical protein